MDRLPFPAIGGQEDLKSALLLNAINRDIGGVPIRGERGTGKSSAVRGLERVLPDIRVVVAARRTPRHGSARRVASGRRFPTCRPSSSSPTVGIEGDPVAETERLARLLGASGVDLVVSDLDRGTAGTDVCRSVAAEADGEYVSVAGVAPTDRTRFVTRVIEPVR